jgi:lipid-binding SYLF domain-containing protein
MRTAMLSIFGIVAMALAGCETASPNSPANRVGLQDDSQTALRQMTSQDPKLQDVISSGYAYAIFPDIGNASLGVGGASGKGVVYQNGQAIGTVKLNQVSVGPQAGGQTYSELIVFQNQDAFNRLVNNSLEFGAQANATLVKAGAAAATHFDQGVAVYILPKGGLEVGANLNGQKFTYMPNSGGM